MRYKLNVLPARCLFAWVGGVALGRFGFIRLHVLGVLELCVEDIHVRLLRRRSARRLFLLGCPCLALLEFPCGGSAGPRPQVIGNAAACLFECAIALVCKSATSPCLILFVVCLQFLRLFKTLWPCSHVVGSKVFVVAYMVVARSALQGAVMNAASFRQRQRARPPHQ